MKNTLLTATLCLVSLVLVGQKVAYEFNQDFKMVKLGSVDVSTIKDDYLAHLQCIEAPELTSPDKIRLAQLKKDIAKIYPRIEEPLIQKRMDVNPPEVLSKYQLNGVQTGIPIDNHLTMSGDYIVSAGNFYMAITNEAGGIFKQFSLSSFANGANIRAQPFDPRLLYDPEAQRYILTFLAGFDSSDTHIVMAFSESDDPRGRWNIYRIEGNPNNKAEWTDYPMVSLTKDKVFLTINLLRDNSSWQLGFVETIIWEIDKQGGYDDVDTISLNSYKDISFDGVNIRNLCPVENAFSELSEDMYFMSNRNFSMESDTFFLCRFDPQAADPLSIKLIKSSMPYGAPPNAKQRIGELQTNDARVLEAFRLGNQIQFVGNTRNLDNNQAGIYHAILEDINTDQTCELRHIIGPNYELGYPGITHVGADESEDDAIISVNHVSPSKSPGTSTIYSVLEVGYSPITEVGTGQNHVDMLNGLVERWGDYHGTQRDFANPDEVWSAGFQGDQSRRNAPYISRVKRPAIPVGTYEVESQLLEVKVAPNPASQRAMITFENPVSSKNLSIELYGMDGSLVDRVYDGPSIKKGQHEFSIKVSHLSSGAYILRVTTDHGVIATEKIVVGN